MLTGRWLTYLSPTSALHAQVNPDPIKSRGQRVSQQKTIESEFLPQQRYSDAMVMSTEALLPQQPAGERNAHKLRLHQTAGGSMSRFCIFPSVSFWLFIFPNFFESPSAFRRVLPSSSPSCLHLFVFQRAGGGGKQVHEIPEG